MSKRDIIRAWKDPEFRRSLTEAQQRMLPENPAGMIELSEAELRIDGGAAGEGTCVCSHHNTCRTCESKCQCTPPKVMFRSRYLAF